VASKGASGADAKSGTVNPREYLTPLFRQSSDYPCSSRSVPYNLGSIQPSVRSFRSRYDRRVPEMKTKVICGGNPTAGVKKTKTRINSRHWNHGVMVSPARRRSSLILIALQLIARKIRAKNKQSRLHSLSQLYYPTAKIVGLQERGLRSMPRRVERYTKWSLG
jgi:hypothetical protein